MTPSTTIHPDEEVYRSHDVRLAYYFDYGFSNIIDEYAAARRAVIVRMFIDALTKGGTNGVPKPIENYAHDKKRYVGDMLAWLRQYVPSEKENLQQFLKSCDTSKEGKLIVFPPYKELFSL